MTGYPPLPKQYTPEAFRRWLSSLPEAGSIAGYAGVQVSCPAARWLSEVMEARVCVDYGFIIYNSIYAYETPDWLERFERKVDGNSMDGEPVRRRRALNLLTRALNDDREDW
jgi:hypothetical protein